MLLGETITLFGGGRQLRDFVYIDDAIASIVAAAKGRLSGSHCFNVGSGIPVSIRRVVEMIADTTGSTYSSSSRQLGGGDVLESYADVSLIKKVLGWEAIVKIEDGIQRTIAAGVDSGL
jgi:nucleoside-diphosphate-sugar epimerase